MHIESRIAKLETHRADANPFADLAPEHAAKIAREYLLGLDVAEVNPDDAPIRWAMELLGIESFPLVAGNRARLLASGQPVDNGQKERG